MYKVIYLYVFLSIFIISKKAFRIFWLSCNNYEENPGKKYCHFTDLGKLIFSFVLSQSVLLLPLVSEGKKDFTHPDRTFLGIIHECAAQLGLKFALLVVLKRTFRHF